MSKNIFNCFLLFLLFVCFPLKFIFSQVKIVVQSDVREIVKNYKLEIDVDPCFSIYKDSISVSVDNPYIKVKNIKILDDSRLEYIPSFRKNKKLFFGPFQLEVLLEFATGAKEQVQKELKRSNIIISFLKLNRNGRSSSEILFVELKDKIIDQTGIENNKNKSEHNVFKKLKSLHSGCQNTEILNENFNFYLFSNFYLFIFSFLLLITLSFYLLFLSIKKNSKSYLIASFFLFSFLFSFLAKFILLNIIPS